MIDNCFVICRADSKAPIGNDWSSTPLSAATVARRLTNNPKLNVGMLLGPVSGVIDIECDCPEAEPNLRKLVGDDLLDITPSWTSTRGSHFLVKYDHRFDGRGQKVIHQGIEFRLGCGKATQSIIPPSAVDGVRREWVRDLSHPVATLPEPVIELLLQLAPLKTAEYTSDDPMFTGLEAELQQGTVAQLSGYFELAGVPFTIRRDHRGRVFIELAYCPIRGPQHNDGAPAVIVNRDGTKAFKCFHSKCSAATFADVEMVLGALHPVVRLGPDTDRVVSEVCTALGRAPGLYQRGGMLVRITREPAPLPLSVTHTTAPRLEPMPQASLGETISSVVRVERHNERKGKFVHCSVPDAITRAVDARSCWSSIPRIEGVISHPTFLPDGSILVAPGYHAASGLYLDTSDAFPPLIPVRQAVDALLEVVVDFPFRNEADRAAWVAGLLTLFARHGFEGAAPIILIDANTRGSGKTLAADGLAVIVEARPAARTSAPGTDEEWRKLLTSIAMAAPPYVLLDNLRGKFGSPALEQALTGGRHSDRVLGSNRVIDVPLRCVWIATSNNVVMTADMARRTLPIRLESPLENPEARKDFRHADLLGWLRRDRARLAIAAVSILHAYHAAGRPDQRLPAWGSFEPWSDLVRSAVVWAGLRDPGENRAALAEAADDETTILRSLLTGWSELGFPLTVAKALETLDTSDEDRYPILRAAIAELDGNRKNALGQLLRRYRGRVLGGRCFERTNSDPPRWHVVQIA